MSFPEEPFNLSILEGGGYYPATIHQKLKSERYEIVRKLGYGSRSSTWLVLDVREDRYFAVKIFTVAASEQAQAQELPMLRAACSINKLGDLALPSSSLGNFWEKSGQGDHLCISLRALSTSLEDYVRESENQTLPVHVVQRIVGEVADALEALHRANVMHGAVKADNILFEIPNQTESLKSLLDSEPPPTTLKIKRYATVQSQPLVHGLKWNNKKSLPVTDWRFCLSNFGHAQRWYYNPEKDGDYLCAPETLLQDSSCSLQTDIWMLGATTFYLLTGNYPFVVKGIPSKQIATMCALLEDDFPEEWLSDRKMNGYNADAHGYVISIEGSLADVLPKDEVAQAAAFIKACLRVDPKKRVTAAEASDHKWLEKSHACSCGFSSTR